MPLWGGVELNRVTHEMSIFSEKDTTGQESHDHTSHLLPRLVWLRSPRGGPRESPMSSISPRTERSKGAWGARAGRDAMGWLAENRAGWSMDNMPCRGVASHGSCRMQDNFVVSSRASSQGKKNKEKENFGDSHEGGGLETAQERLRGKKKNMSAKETWSKKKRNKK